jgi:hypothetical protein
MPDTQQTPVTPGKMDLATLRAKIKPPAKTVASMSGSVKSDDVDAILNKHQPSEVRYSKTQEERAEKATIKATEKKKNREEAKRTSVYMAYADFLKYGELKNRIARKRQILTYEILIRFAMDKLESLSDQECEEIIARYKE